MSTQAKPGRLYKVLIYVLPVAALFSIAASLLVWQWDNVSPVVEEKYESLQYHLYELMPRAEHPEFLPTPLPTAVAAQHVAAKAPTKVVILAQTATATTVPSRTNTVAPSRSSNISGASSQSAENSSNALRTRDTATPTNTPLPTATPTEAVAIKPIQPAVTLTGFQHEYQGFNNCGPTTLHVYLSFYGRKDSQHQIASVVKPNPLDKNVTPDQIAAYARSIGMNATVRVNGTIDRLKTFLSNGIPVVAEMGFVPTTTHEGWMGHYRLLTAYDDQKFVAQDTYLGPNFPLPYADFDANWKAFNRTYYVVYTDAQAPLVRAIIGDDMDDTHMYSAAAGRAQQELDANPNDAFAAFNLGSSLNGVKQYADAAAAFDRALTLKLPWRMLWYQFGPYEAYYHVGRYDDVLRLADAILKTTDDLEESHYYKGLALEKLGRLTEARNEFATALRYNKNYADPQRELAQLPGQGTSGN